MNLKKYRFTGKKKFDIKEFDTSDEGKFASKEEALDLMQANLDLTEEYQDKLYAEGKTGVLIILQAMDAAGKDGAVKHIFSGLNPQGVDVHSFKQPSSEELMHDYLWRAAQLLPKRGKIAIFNRSYYEDVLIAKVHKLYLNQNLPDRCLKGDVIEKRYEQIRNFEKYLCENGIVIIKLFLHISKDEQKKQFLERIDVKEKNWKFDKSDIQEREYWDEYQDAYEKAINETATEKCPWFIIPSDKRWFAREMISEIFLEALKEIDPQYPELSKEAKSDLKNCKKALLKNS